MRIRTSRAVALAAAIALTATACGGDGDDEDATASTDDDGSAAEGVDADGVVVRMDGESVDDYIDRLYEAAAEEGQVLYYTSSADDEVQLILDTWEEVFPDVQIEPVTATSGTILERALVEAESGNIQGDVYTGSGVDMTALDEVGAWAEYRPAREEFVAEEFLMDGPWVATGYLSWHVAYNTDLVSAEDLPDDFMGYCDEEWTGRLAIDLEGGEWAAGLISGLGEEEATEFLECLAEVEPRLVRGSTNRTELLAAGEYDVQLDAYGHRIAGFSEEGAPVAGQVPTPDPLITAVDLLAIFEGAPNPNAARLMMEFFLMEEGQALFNEHNKPGVLEGNDSHPYPDLMEGGEIVVMGPGDVDFDAATGIFNDIFLR